MDIKRIITILTAVACAVFVAAATASAASAPSNASILIRHQLRGCHSWSVNGGAFKPNQTVALRAGGWINVTNSDVMSHKLVQTSGPAVQYVGKPSLNRTNPTVKIVFKKAGVYSFTTKAGEDYMAGIKTVGEDNVLKLKVAVS